MKMCKSLLPVSAALLVSLSWFPAFADAGKVVIGDIDDMSGLYADINGPGAVEAIKMAIADFGGSALGQPIELLTADHQNKPDLGVQKFREWADRDGLTMVLGGANTGVSLAISAAVKEKRVPFFAIGAAGASLTGKDCTPYTVHYAYDTTALGNGTATTIVNEGGKTWFFVTADYAFGTQLQDSAARVVTANGGKVVGAVRVPLATSDFASYVLQAQNSGAQVLGLANAGPDFSNALKAANELGITKTMKPAALLAFITDIRALGLETAQGLYLTTPWYWDLDDKSRAFAKRFLDKVGREPTFHPSCPLFRDDHVSQRGQSRRFDRPGQGDGRAAQDENQRHVHRGRDDPRRRTDGAFDVRHAGQEAIGVEISLGLLPDRPKNVGRAGVRQARGFDLRAGQEVTLRWSPRGIRIDGAHPPMAIP